MKNFKISVLTANSRYLQTTALNHYWKRWQREYLHLLSVRSKWQEENPSIREGDIVLVSDDNVSRTKWPKARVEKVHPGKDGLCERLL